MKITLSKKWFMNICDHEAARFNIICFPYGGGGASVFWPWKALSLEANVWAIKLPGREDRIAEMPITSAKKFINQIIKVLPTNYKLPLIFYGHSMGAGLAFQTIIELQKRAMQLPVFLIASGREPPHFTYPNITTELDDNTLVNYLQKLGGVRGEIIRNQDFLKQYLLKIRADYQLNSSIPIQEPTLLPLYISIINGIEDPILQSDVLNQWSKHTKYPLNTIILPGGHFFIHENFQKFIHEVEKQILERLL